MHAIQDSCIVERVLTKPKSTSFNSSVHLNDLEPCKHNSVDGNREKEILVLIKVVATDTAMLRFSATIYRNHHGSKTNGVNDPFSTSRILSLYFRFFSVSFLS